MSAALFEIEGVDEVLELLHHLPGRDAEIRRAITHFSQNRERIHHSSDEDGN